MSNSRPAMRAMLALVAALLLLPFPALRAQPPAAPSTDAANSSLRLARLLDEIWQAKLSHDPEYATFLGDKRYDTELDDRSPRAINDALARGRDYIARLSAIDTTGLSHQEQLSVELQLRDLIED